MNASTDIFTSESVAEWYRKEAPRYQDLSDNVTAAIASLLKTKKVAALTVAARVKSLESILEKFDRKQYVQYADLTDFLGVRVIVYLDSDIPTVCALLEGAFHAHADLGVDKSEELAVDQIGYRSVHYICDLGNLRLALDELAQYKEMKFEIQVRTVLQHAWAEIEHDRSYKFSGDLPQIFRRRLNLLAGTLELVDREFSTLAKDLDEHVKQAAETNTDEIVGSVELDAEIVSRLLDDLPHGMALAESQNNSLGTAVDELIRFGVCNVSQLRSLLSSDFWAALKDEKPTTKVGLLRKAMIFADIDKYFAQAWGREFTGLTSSTRAMVAGKFGNEKLSEIDVKYLRPANQARQAKKNKAS